jgi:hypothetical protein
MYNLETILHRDLDFDKKVNSLEKKLPTHTVLKRFFALNGFNKEP